jgi:hypothetical protein
VRLSSWGRRRSSALLGVALAGALALGGCSSSGATAGAGSGVGNFKGVGGRATTHAPHQRTPHVVLDHSLISGGSSPHHTSKAKSHHKSGGSHPTTSAKGKHGSSITSAKGKHKGKGH